MQNKAFYPILVKSAAIEKDKVFKTLERARRYLKENRITSENAIHIKETSD